MKRFLVSLLAICLLLTACGARYPASVSQAPVLLTLANSHNAEHITSQACQYFADAVFDATDGRITIVCYFDGEKGDERSTIQQCQFGGLDFTRVSSGVAAEFAPLMNALQMPYEYTDADHLFRVLDGDIGQEVFDTLPDVGLVGLTYLHPGSRNFFNAVREIHTPADLEGLRIRVSESDLMLSLLSSLGSTGVGLPFNQTYDAIQSGLVDGAENNMTSYVEMSFYEVAPYWTYDSHSYMPDMLLASRAAMDRLSAQDRQILMDCAREAEIWHRDAWESSEAENARIAAEQHCVLTTLTEEEVQQFKDAVSPLYDTFLTAEQQELVARVQALG